MDFPWPEILPPHIANRQAAWERRYKAWRMQQAGVTLKAIGAALGVSAERARRIATRYSFKGSKEKPSPAWEWFKRDISSMRDVCRLADMINQRMGLKRNYPCSHCVSVWLDADETFLLWRMDEEHPLPRRCQ